MCGAHTCVKGYQQKKMYSGRNLIDQKQLRHWNVDEISVLKVAN